MIAFQPKHYNYGYKSVTNNIFITEDNYIVVSSKLKSGIIYNYSDLESDLDADLESDSDADSNDNQENSIEIPTKYEILYDNGTMTYEELMEVNNAISVCSTLNGYIILLDNRKLIYCMRANFNEFTLLLKETLDPLQVEYIDNNNGKIIIYSNLSLYFINNSTYKVKEYKKVIGYVSHSNIALILFNDNRVMCQSHQKLYKIELHADQQIKLDVDTDNIFDGIDLNSITEIKIFYNQIYVLSGDIIKAFTCSERHACLSYIIKHANILSIDRLNGVCIFLLKDGRLFLKSSETVSDIHACHENVAEYLFVGFYIVCFYFDGSIECIDSNDYNGLKSAGKKNTLTLYKFLNDIDNISLISRIKTYLHYGIIEDLHVILYINHDNTVEMLDIVNLNFIDLSVCLDVDTKSLPLINYSGGSYI